MSADVREDRDSGQDESVLRLRLAILRRNLEQVRDTGGSVAQRRDEIQALEDVFDQTEGIQMKSDWVVENVEAGMKLVELLLKVPGIPEEAVKRLRGRLEECSRHACDVKEQAGVSANIITGMVRRWSSLSADEVFDAHIREIFADKAKHLMDVIDQLSRDPADAAWATYQNEIRAAAGDLFSEYVDFLSGLALRDSGLTGPVAAHRQPDAGTGQENGSEDGPGSDVYVMVDDLVKQIYRIGESDLWTSLTIPARRDAAARTVARMIRLGFPEWTVWAVPLSACEFGRVVIDKKRKDISRRFEARGETFGRGFEVVLADAFATYALGPAYAFASVYVRLDPSIAERRPAEQGHSGPGSLRGDCDRAFVVFRTLELMNEGEALTPVIDQLRQRWAAAVAQAGGAAPPTGEVAELLVRQTERIWEFLQQDAPTIRYTGRRWDQATGWPPLVDLLDRPARLGQGDVRDILNAAWFQRLNADTMSDPALDQELGDAALALWRRDFASRRRSSYRGVF
jgi:hypothetical protein